MITNENLFFSQQKAKTNGKNQHIAKKEETNKQPLSIRNWSFARMLYYSAHYFLTSAQSYRDFEQMQSYI